MALDSLKIDNDGEQTESFSPLEFLAKLSQHIPNTWEQTVLYFGAYSSRTRGACKITQALTEQETSNDNSSTALIIPPTSDEQSFDSDKTTITSTWARCIKKVYGVDPLVCPKCHSHMKIIAFIHNHKEIKKIADHIGIVTWTKPPSIAPPSKNITYEEEPQ